MNTATWISRKNISCLKTGDIIEVPSKIPYTDIIIPIVYHYGVVAEICGTKYVTHIPWGNTPIFESLDRFEKKRNITRVIRDENTIKLKGNDILSGYYEYKDEIYDFFNFNCEDYVNGVCKRNIGFDQRRGYLIGFLLTAIIIIAIYNKK